MAYKNFAVLIDPQTSTSTLFSSTKDVGLYSSQVVTGRRVGATYRYGATFTFNSATTLEPHYSVTSTTAVGASCEVFDAGTGTDLGSVTAVRTVSGTTITYTCLYSSSTAYRAGVKMVLEAAEAWNYNYIQGNEKYQTIVGRTNEFFNVKSDTALPSLVEPQFYHTLSNNDSRADIYINNPNPVPITVDLMNESAVADEYDTFNVDTPHRIQFKNRIIPACSMGTLVMTTSGDYAVEWISITADCHSPGYAGTTVVYEWTR